MTKITFSVTDNLKFEVNVEQECEMFQKIARLQEVFGEKTCGICDSDRIRYNAYKVKSPKGEYIQHQMVCDNCNGHLLFGQHNNGKGTLFSKRNDSPKTRGWKPTSQQPMPNQKEVVKSKVEITPTKAEENGDWEVPNLSADVPF